MCSDRVHAASSVASGPAPMGVESRGNKRRSDSAPEDSRVAEAEERPDTGGGKAMRTAQTRAAERR